MILRAIFALLILILLLTGINFLNKNYINNYSIRAWDQYEAQVLSSGAPPKSDIDIKKEKLDEVNRFIDNHYYDFEAILGFGPIGVSISYTDCFAFHVLHYD